MKIPDILDLGAYCFPFPSATKSHSRKQGSKFSCKLPSDILVNHVTRKGPTPVQIYYMYIYILYIVVAVSFSSIPTVTHYTIVVSILFPLSPNITPVYYSLPKPYILAPSPKKMVHLAHARILRSRLWLQRQEEGPTLFNGVSQNCHCKILWEGTVGTTQDGG